MTKPGIIAGNALTATGGYFLAARGHIVAGRLLATVAGISLVIAAACVVNNYIDRDIDSKMSRTRWRSKATDRVSLTAGISYACLLVTTGWSILLWGANWLTAGVGAVGVLFYVVFYSIMKRRSVHGTLVGCVSGATPLVAGYTAVKGHLDAATVLLLLVMVFWQLAHFYAIGLYRVKDYRAAGLPIMPVVKGERLTKRLIIANIAAFGLCAGLLTAFHYTGYAFLVIITAITAGWLWRGWRGFGAAGNVQWARGMFGFSLVVITVFSLSATVNAWLP